MTATQASAARARKVPLPRQGESSTPAGQVDPPRLLVVEDDELLRHLIVEVLRAEGYLVDEAPDGERALHAALHTAYDVIVLDRGLPGIDGIEVIRRLQADHVSSQVMLLTAAARPADRVEGLDVGAQDYVTKPFDLAELTARVRVMLRRTGLVEESALPVPGGVLVPDQGLVRLSTGAVVALSGRELDLLLLLSRNPQRVFGHAELVALAFEGKAEESTVDTYVSYLRRKLGRGVARTVHGLGYRLGSL